MNLIAAVDKNWAIGKNNELLVSIPNDMKMFRQMTTGKVVVMGRKTLESFPNGLPLKNRVNIVLTKNQNYQVKGTGKGQKESDQSRSWMAVSDHCGDPVCIYCCFLFRSVQNEHRTGDEQYLVRRRCCSVK